MYSQRRVRLAGVKAQPFKVQKGRTYRLPGFEGFSGGSWWDVDIIDQRDKYYLARYLSNSAEEDESWLPLKHLRLRTRKADDWDCHILRRGMDISVFGVHSDHEDLVLHPKALYDARITQLSRVAHDMECTCRFHVTLFCVREEEDPSLGRTLLTDFSATREVDISHVSILQQPVNLTIEEILRSHMLEEWLTIKWCNDAYFLAETKLTVGDNGDHISTDPLPPFAATRSDNLGASVRRSRVPTSVQHETDRNAACKGKAYASARDSFHHKQKFDAANKTTSGLKRDGRDLEPDVRASSDVRELDDLWDEHGTRNCGRRRPRERGAESDYEAVRGGLGGGASGRAYDKSGKEKEEFAANASSEREKYHERDWKVRPDNFEFDGGITQRENLENGGTGKSVRGDFVESASKARRVDVEENIAHQNGVETSPELVGRGKTGRDEVLRPFRKEGVSPHQTTRRCGSPQREEETRKRNMSHIIIDSSTEEEESEYVGADSVCSDEINGDRQTQPKKKTRNSRNKRDDDDPEVVVKLSKGTEEGIIRRNRPRKTRRGKTQLGSDKGYEDPYFRACWAPEVQHKKKDQPEVKGRKCSPRKKSDRSPVGPDRELISEDKHTGAEKASQSVRRRGRPRKSTATKRKASGKEQRKHSASSKHASPQRKARSKVQDAKNAEPKAESSPKTKASAVINLEDDNCDETEDDAPIRMEGLGTERKRTRGSRGSRERQRKEGTYGDKVAPDTHQSEGHDGGQRDVILAARLRSQTSEKKKPLSAGSSLPAKHFSVEVEDAGVRRFVQRPLYLDVFDDSTHDETQVEDGDVAEKHKSHEPGGNLDSDLGTTRYLVSVLEENHAVVDLQNQTAIPLECQVTDADAKLGPVSGIKVAGQVIVEPIVVDSPGKIGGETVAERPSVVEHETVVREALTLLDSPDKTTYSSASGEDADAEKLNMKVDSQACDGEVAISSDAALEKL